MLRHWKPGRKVSDVGKLTANYSTAEARDYTHLFTMGNNKAFDNDKDATQFLSDCRDITQYMVDNVEMDIGEDYDEDRRQTADWYHVVFDYLENKTNWERLYYDFYGHAARGNAVYDPPQPQPESPECMTQTERKDLNKERNRIRKRNENECLEHGMNRYSSFDDQMTAAKLDIVHPRKRRRLAEAAEITDTSDHQEMQNDMDFEDEDEDDLDMCFVGYNRRKNGNVNRNITRNTNRNLNFNSMDNVNGNTKRKSKGNNNKKRTTKKGSRKKKGTKQKGKKKEEKSNERNENVDDVPIGFDWAIAASLMFGGDEKEEKKKRKRKKKK